MNRFFMLAISLVLVPSAGATISFVQGNTATSHAASSVAIAYRSNNASGNLLVAAAGSFNSMAQQTLTISDSAGNAWSQAVVTTSFGSTALVYIWYAVNSKAGPNTVTFTPSRRDGDIDATIYEYSGIATSSPLDQTNSATCSSCSSLSTGNVSTTQASELLFSYAYETGRSDATFRVSSGWVKQKDRKSVV